MDRGLARLANLALILIAAVFVARALEGTRGRASGLPLPRDPVPLMGAEVMGEPTAKVAVIEFSEFQCPYCAQAAEKLLPTLVANYVKTGKVRLSFRHMALSEIHKFALRAGAGAACAGRQGRFWELHDALFANQSTLTDDHIQELASRLGLDMHSFDNCWDTEGKATVNADGMLATRLGVNSTPSFFLGTVEHDMVTVKTTFEGVQPVAAFLAALDRLLSS